MHLGYHHWLHHRKLSGRPKRRQVSGRVARLFDESVYVAAFISVASNLAQLGKIIAAHSTQGVSIITWVGFLLGTIFWLGYGIVHREKPIIFANVCLFFVQGAIVAWLLWLG
ncbi:SemiSWEET family transporter [Patescibacteria group bacterium]|nr:SemiSWEET family transporter [Patescibacteria group bacterium]